MIKSVLKWVIFLMGIQSFIGNLEKQGIVSGSIKINFPVLYTRIVSILQSEEMNGLIDNMNSAEIDDYISPAEVQAVEQHDNRRYVDQQYQRQWQQDDVQRLEYRVQRNCIERPQNSVRRTSYVTHRVRRGETLSNVAEIYGISWKVIKKANCIFDEHKLQIGQRLIIPRPTGALG